MINLNPMAGIAKALMGGLDGLFTSDEERAKAELSLNHQLQQPHILQALANIEEAKHPSVFVSCWRPALGWLCVLILAWTWIVRDLVIIGLMLVDKLEVVQQLPTVDTGTVITLLLCLLGLGGCPNAGKTEGCRKEIAMGDEDRFNRIEQKLDGITQILQTLAKHDERMVNLALREKRSEERLDAIEKSVLKNSTISSVIQWIAATTTAGIIAFAIKQFL